MKLQGFERNDFSFFMVMKASIIIAVAVGLSLFLFCGKSGAQETSNYKTFDIATDVDFKNYRNVLRQFVANHRPETSNDFCIVGYLFEDSSKLAWVLWRQGRQIILWENQDANLDFSRRKINMETDVVKTDSDLHGSTYLVTKAWVNNLTATCDRSGTKVHMGKREK